MRILFLTQIIPYPPDAGPRIKTWNVLRYLAGCGHQVVLASFVRPEEEAYLPVLKQVCSEVHAVPIRRSRAGDLVYGLKSLFSGKPFLIERDDLPAMRSLVRRLVSAGSVDAIHCDQVSMAQFALGVLPPVEPGRRLYRVFDAHNAVWKIFARMGQNAPWFLRPLIAWEAARVRRYEGRVVRVFDLTLAVTGLDREALLEAAGDSVVSPSIQVIPIAVDTGALALVNRQPCSRNLLTLGTLHYPPNADGIRWFVQEVFPLVRAQAPDARLTIVGKNPPRDFTQAAERSAGAIAVTGYVPDLTPSLEAAAMAVIPVRAGGGMRVRILEALSRGLPVVTTTVGLEGIDARPGEEVLVADTAQEFAEAVTRLLGDPGLQAQLAERGRRLAEAKYDWHAVLGQLGSAYDRANERAGHPEYVRAAV